MTVTSIEVSSRGRWVRVPAVVAKGFCLIVTGRFLRIAAIHDEAWADSEIDDPERCLKMLQEARASGFRADLFTFSKSLPLIVERPDWRVEWDSVATVGIADFDSWWSKLPQATRKNVRRAKKRGVEVRLVESSDEIIRGIVELNNATQVRQGKRNTHFGKSFDEVRRDYASFQDRSDMIGAFVGSELVGVMKIVYRNQRASVLQCLPKAGHEDKRPANAMMAVAIELCAAKGITELTYGMYRYGKKADNSLLEFKVRNGFEETLVPRYYVPLTPWGSICLKVGAHNGLIGMLPSWAIAAMVNLRAKWQNRKSAPETESAD